LLKWWPLSPSNYPPPLEWVNGYVYRYLLNHHTILRKILNHIIKRIYRWTYWYIILLYETYRYEWNVARMPLSNSYLPVNIHGIQYYCSCSIQTHNVVIIIIITVVGWERVHHKATGPSTARSNSRARTDFAKKTALRATGVNDLYNWCQSHHRRLSPNSVTHALARIGGKRIDDVDDEDDDNNNNNLSSLHYVCKYLRRV